MSCNTAYSEVKIAPTASGSLVSLLSPGISFSTHANPLTPGTTYITECFYNPNQIVPTGADYPITMASFYNTTGKLAACTAAFNTIIFSGTGSSFNPEGYAYVKGAFDYMGYQMFNSNGILRSNDPGYNSFQQTLVDDLCNNTLLPGVCSGIQNQLCTNCTQSSIINNSDLKTMCGCIVPQPSYSISSGVTQACEPVCRNSVKLSNSGNLIECNQTVCVINDISIASAGSSIGSVNITQICPACTNGCTCVIDATISGIGKSVGLDETNFVQNCGSNATCFVIANGKATPTDCVTRLFPSVVSESKPLKINYYFWVVMLMLMVVGIFIVYYTVDDVPKVTKEKKFKKYF